MADAVTGAVTGLLIRNAEVWRGPGEAQLRADLRIVDGLIVEIGAHASHPAERVPGERVIEAGGGLLLPGLHDHHIHLASLAARRASVICGPGEVSDEAALAARLAGVPGSGWIRGILYHESVMGLPDAAALDRLVPHRPLRIQHRSGRMWLLNGAALDDLLARGTAPEGLERVDGRFTGRLFDEDAWLRTTLAGAPPDFAEVSQELARFGVTGLTDMSPTNDEVMAAHFARQIAGGGLCQRVLIAGTLALAEARREGWHLGPAKLHLHEAALPDPDAAVRFIAAAHAQGRAVAIHCTTEVELVYALSVLRAANTQQDCHHDRIEHRSKDRIEHAGIAPDHLVREIAELQLAVVTQPHFIAERGDAYRAGVEPALHDALYRLAAFHKAGVTLAGGSDAPFGSADPWAAMRAATSRTTASGAPIGTKEALSPEQALALYLADPADLRRECRIAIGARADLTLLDRPWREARGRLRSEDVIATLIGGQVVSGTVG